MHGIIAFQISCFNSVQIADRPLSAYLPFALSGPHERIHPFVAIGGMLAGFVAYVLILNLWVNRARGKARSNAADSKQPPADSNSDSATPHTTATH